MHVEIPQNFLERMQKIVGNELSAFAACYDLPHYRGIRFNPLKGSLEQLKRSMPFPLEASPFSSDSFYIPADVKKLGTLPLHHAGAFYVQEPSASSAVSVLNPQPGERILDLCAAPGGKSTQIAGKLQGEGLLWSNEYVKNRATVLLSNLERMGVRNAVVSNVHPEKLCSALAGFFDKVLVDAPCSGEGMFRKEPEALEAWSPEHVEACAARQKAILDSAAQTVREGGVLVYSTCTFSEEENEGVVSSFLQEHPEFALEDCGVSFGRAGKLAQTRRIFPMDGGEGHFVAKMRCVSQKPYGPSPFQYPASDKKVADFYEMLFCNSLEQPMAVFGKNVVLLPQNLPDLTGLNILRAGVLLGEMKPNRIEPAHAVFMASKPEELRTVVSLSHDSPEIAAFLHGEELEVADDASGYAGVAVDGILTGFGKCSGGRLKNHYPKGLRNFT